MLKIIPILILCLVAIGVFVSCGGYPGSPEGILKQDVRAFRDGDAKAYYETCSPDFREKISLEEYEEAFPEFRFYREPVEFRNVEVEYVGIPSVWETVAQFDFYVGGELQYDKWDVESEFFVEIDGKWYKNCW